MIKKIGKHYVFYRHALFGSAVVLGGVISQYFFGYSYLIFGYYIVGVILFLNSLLVSYTVSKYPEEFQEEINEINRLKEKD